MNACGMDELDVRAVGALGTRGFFYDKGLGRPNPFQPKWRKPKKRFTQNSSRPFWVTRRLRPSMLR